MLSPLIFANTFIKRALDTKTPLSPMKLQKLLYFLYARYAFLNDAPLFSEQFEAWPYGPVLSEVYDAFKHFGARSIDEFSKDCNGEVGVISEHFLPFFYCFDQVWGKFSSYNGIYLSHLTHQDNTAWSKAWSNCNFLQWEDIKIDGEQFFT